MMLFPLPRAAVLCGLLCAGLMMSANLRAEEPAKPEVQAKPPLYQPAGAPADPQVPVRWNLYHDYTAATEILQKLAAEHPGHFRLQSLGKSHEGREMWLATVTNFGAGKVEEKPAFWIDGGIHANEIQSVEVVLYTAWYLAELNGRSPFITKLLNERVFYLVPMMSPDSRDAHMHRPNNTHSPRSGQIPVDDDRDGRINEDGPDDLNGDGSITQMRIADPRGNFKPDEKFPELMVRVGSEERGSYRLLGSEGLDNDGDGEIDEDGDGYYDPNRNWPWNWQPSSAEGGSYRYPLSVPENRLVGDFILAHPQIAGAQSYHNAAGMLLRGPGAKNDQMPGADIAIYDRLGKQGEQLLPGYRYLECATGLYEAHGTEFDFFFGLLGTFAFTNEMNTPQNLFGKAGDGGFFGSQESLHRFNRDLLFEDGVVPWKAFDHPQYGKIEIGGMTKNWVRQPASFMLEEELHRNMAFTLYHADQMPQVAVEEVTVKALAGDVSEVTAIVSNRKWIPTHSTHDVEKHINPPDRLQISGPDLTVITAFTDSTPAFLTPTEHNRRSKDVRVPTLRLQPVYVRWLVRGPGPFTVTVRSVKGGVASRSSATDPAEKPNTSTEPDHAPSKD